MNDGMNEGGGGGGMYEWIYRCHYDLSAFDDLTYHYRTRRSTQLSSVEDAS